MPNPPPVADRKRDFELCKVIFGAALSQVHFARRSFAPSSFQVIPLRSLIGPRFEDIIATGLPVDRHDPELLRDQENILFLRADAHDYDLSHFLGILTTDIFPLIEREELVKFRISYLSSPKLTKGSLVEYYTFVFKYKPGERYGIDIWRAGTGKQHIAASHHKLWNLGDYLSRLTPFSEPIFATLAFHARQRPTEPSIGLWGFNRSAFEDANLRLQQRDEYSFERIAHIEIGPLLLPPRTQQPITAEQDLGTAMTRGKEGQEEDATGDTPADDLPFEEPQEEGLPEEGLQEEEGSFSSVLEPAVVDNAAPEENNTREDGGSKTSADELRLPRTASVKHLEATRPTPSPPPRKARKVGAKKASNTKAKPKAKAPRGNTSASKGQRKGKARGKAPEKNIASQTPDSADHIPSSTRKPGSTRRKPKAPLQLEIYEDVDSQMTETQPAGRLSQLKSQHTPAKRKRGDSQLLDNPRSKRLKSPPEQFSVLSSVGNSMSNGIMSPDNTQPQSEEHIEPSPRPTVVDNVAGRLADIASESGSDEPVEARLKPKGVVDIAGRIPEGSPSPLSVANSAEPSTERASRFGRRSRDATSRKGSLFEDFVSTSSGNEDEDDEEGQVDAVASDAMSFEPEIHDSNDETNSEEASGETADGNWSLFSGVAASDDESDYVGGQSLFHGVVLTDDEEDGQED